VIYFNIKTEEGVETIDELDSSKFAKRRDFIAEKRNMIENYWMSGVNVYISSRSTKEWRENQ